MLLLVLETPRARKSWIPVRTGVDKAVTKFGGVSVTGVDEAVTEFGGVSVFVGTLLLFCGGTEAVLGVGVTLGRTATGGKTQNRLAVAG